jgi:hypothetical protein
MRVGRIARAQRLSDGQAPAIGGQTLHAGVAACRGRVHRVLSRFAETLNANSGRCSSATLGNLRAS